MTLEDLRKQYREIIFVFGSNKSGHHGKGAALVARKVYGAIYGQGYGLQGRSYAIPTKGTSQEKGLPLSEIEVYVGDFLKLAHVYNRTKPDVAFLVTPIGTGEAGYEHGEIAPMFSTSPSNCYLPERWYPILRSLGVELGPRRFLRRQAGQFNLSN